MEGRISIGEAAGDCLKAVYKLQASENRVTTSALAARLGVTEPTVTAMVKRLARLGLLHHAPYRGVELMPAGEKVALEIIRHHRLLELYLVEALGLSWEKVHVEAERLEHFLSDELEDRMDAALGHPTLDPHGDPIPSKDGQLHQEAHSSLADLDPEEVGIICRVPDDNSDLLQYLARLGLVPGALVRVVDRAPFDGPLTLQVGEARHIIGRELARLIQIRGSPSAETGDPAE